MLIGFTSCEKDSANYFENIASPTGELTSKDFLRLHVTQDVIFHYSVMDKANEQYSGWIIDNKGDLRKYSVTGDASFLDEAYIEAADFGIILSGATKMDYEIDLDELVDHYKKIGFINVENLSTEANNNANTEVTRGFYAYKFDQSSGRSSNSNSGGCATGCNSSKDNSLVRITLFEEDQQTRSNQDASAKNMVEWLSMIKEAN